MVYFKEYQGGIIDTLNSSSILCGGTKYYSIIISSIILQLHYWKYTFEWCKYLVLQITCRKTISVYWSLIHLIQTKSTVNLLFVICRIQLSASTDYLLDSRATSSTITTNAVNSVIYSGLDNGTIITLQLSGEEMKYSSISLNYPVPISSIAIDPSSSCVGNSFLLANI